MERRASERDEATRCPLCGEANRCARAEASVDAQAIALASVEADASPCWCFERRFPAALLARARARDAGRACVCAACLVEALRREGEPEEAPPLSLPVLR